MAVLAAADQRGHASLYFLTDSRISWQGRNGTWDFGRKTFFSRTTPDIFAFCGDALFPSMVLPQIVGLVEAGLAFRPGASFHQRFDKVRAHVTEAFTSYPLRQVDLTIVHGGRDGDGMDSSFWIGVMNWSHSANRWLAPVIARPPQGSGIGFTAGSGTSAIRRAVNRWNKAGDPSTSRRAFVSFLDSLKSRADPLTGGPPQMVGLYRIDGGRQFGILWNYKGYVGGLVVGQQTAESLAIEWRNELFERVSVVTRKRVPGAQRHTDVATTRP